MYIPQSRLDYFVLEDVPYIDLTTQVLGIGGERGRMEHFTREDCVVAGVEEAERIMRSLGLASDVRFHSGERARVGDVIIESSGTVEALHTAWKVCLNLLDHLSAVATKTREMVDAAHAVNPWCSILTTRKSMPGVKDLLTSAVVAAGAHPHRLGLSETVLVFNQHLEFFGGIDALIAHMDEIRARCGEKRLMVETDAEGALKLARAGVDAVQLDKEPTCVVREVVAQLKAINPGIIVVAAGGIGPHNTAEYAATGVDGLVTTAPFTAKPIDMSTRMKRDD